MNDKLIITTYNVFVKLISGEFNPEVQRHFLVLIKIWLYFSSTHYKSLSTFIVVGIRYTEVVIINIYTYGKKGTTWNKRKKETEEGCS